jgi:uncharacterized protein YciI
MTKLYSIVCRDKPNVLKVRKEKLPDHLAHIETVLDQVAVAGPHYDEAGNLVGSLLVVKADSAAAARAFLEQDPYYQAGIWEQIDIHHFSTAAGDWVGGKAW